MKTQSITEPARNLPSKEELLNASPLIGWMMIALYPVET
jgi:hypothetical protein